MSTRVRVRDVEVRTDADLTPKQIRALLRTCAGIALGLAEATGEPERPTIGFTALVERQAEVLADAPGYEDEG